MECNILQGFKLKCSTVKVGDSIGVQKYCQFRGMIRL